MFLKVCAVLDVQASAFNNPFFVPSIGTAVRSFGDEVNRVPTTDRPNVYNAHPEDFQLYCFGDWDISTGKFSLLDVPELIFKAIDA